MNKGELVAVVAEKAGCTQKQVEVILTALTKAVTEQVASGDKVTLVGFGTFERRDRAARDFINPQTRQKVRSKPTRIAAFTPGKDLRDKVAATVQTS